MHTIAVGIAKDKPKSVWQSYGKGELIIKERKWKRQRGLYLKHKEQSIRIFTIRYYRQLEPVFLTYYEHDRKQKLLFLFAINIK